MSVEDIIYQSCLSLLEVPLLRGSIFVSSYSYLPFHSRSDALSTLKAQSFGVMPIHLLGDVPQSPATTTKSDTGLVDLKHVGKPEHEQTRRLVKRNTLARGLARQYDAQKAQEAVYKARLARQIQRRESKESEYMARRSKSPTLHRNQLGSDSHDDLHRSDEDRNSQEEGGVILRIRTSPKSTAKSATHKRDGARVVPAKHVKNFPRERRLHPPMNQSSEEELVFKSIATQDSSITDYMDPSSVVHLLPTSPLVVRSTRRLGSHSPASPRGLQQSVPSPQSIPLSKSLNPRHCRSSALMVLELRIAKDILVREQTVRQLNEVSSVFDGLANELVNVVEAKRAAEAIAGAGAARMFRARRGSSSSISLLRPDSGSGQSNAAAMAIVKENITALSAQLDQIKGKIQRRLVQIGTFILSLRDATTNIVEGISEWRAIQKQQRTCTNFDPLLRFSWRNGKVPNYMLHLSSDLVALHRSSMIAYLLGIDAEYNPLLLPQVVVSPNGSGSSHRFHLRTFLTDKVTLKDGELISGQKPVDNGGFSHDRRTYDALIAYLPKPESNLIDACEGRERERWRSCLETIEHEHHLEQQDHNRLNQDVARIEHDYNPFESIMASGGVEEQFSNLIVAQSPHVERLRRQLRHRQQDVSDPIEQALSGSQADDHHLSSKSNLPLRVSSRRLQIEMQRRRDARDALTKFELRDPYLVMSADATSGKRNRLHGSMVVRKKPIRPRFSREDYLASVIQRQYRAYRERGHVLRSLADLVKLVRSSSVDIQRIFRGHRVKLRFRDVLSRRNKERRRRLMAVRKIIRVYRRYKRRQKHHQAMTMMAIAQEQLFSVQAAKVHDAENAALAVNEETERLRRLGAERRKYRIAMMEQQKREQIALEIKRMASAIIIQSAIRMHQAKQLACRMREERKDHLAAVCAITIQSNIRMFLVRQEARRARFRRDLERVNRSATRIQSVYRGYSARSQKSETETLIEDRDQEDEDYIDWDGKLPLLLSSPATQIDDSLAKPKIPPVVLPPLVRPPTSSSGSRRPSRQLPSTPIVTATPMTRVELKLNQPVFGDNFQDPPSGSSSARGWRGRF